MPKSEKRRKQRMIRVLLEGIPDQRRMLDMPFPYKQVVDDGSFLVHLSTVERMMSRGWVTRLTPDARAYIRRYRNESAMSFRDRTYPTHESVVDDWLPHLNLKHYRPLPYQIAGMERLYRRANDFFSGNILADDVGLGKTPQTIGLISRLRTEKKLRAAIVVTTTSTRHQWVSEFGKMAQPKFKCVNVQGNQKQRIDRFKSDADIYVVNHEIIRYPHYRHWIDHIMPKVDAIVIDESSALKNPDTITHNEWYERAKQVKWCWPLNATPIENGLSDLWANAHFVDEMALGKIDGYATRYTKRDDFGKPCGVQNLKELRKRVSMCLYRRTRDHVTLQLPSVRVQLREVDLHGEQKRVYEGMVGEAIGSGPGAVRMSRLAKVQRAALGNQKRSSKLEDLCELLDGDLSGERVVIFTRFKECAKLAEYWLNDFRPLMITGDTPHRQRAYNQRRFGSKHGVGRVLIGTEAMDRGLNLQAAGVLVNLDLPWTPAKLRQRIGRINRVGQERSSILVINYIAKHPKGGTIDDYMVSQLIPKRELFRDILGDSDVDEVGNEHIDPEAMTKYISAVLKST